MPDPKKDDPKQSKPDSPAQAPVYDPKARASGAQPELTAGVRTTAGTAQRLAVPVSLQSNEPPETVVTHLVNLVKAQTLKFNFEAFSDVADAWVCDGQIHESIGECFKKCGDPTSECTPRFTGLSTYSTLNTIADFWMLTNVTPFDRYCQYTCTLPSALQDFAGEANFATHVVPTTDPPGPFQGHLKFLADAAKEISSGTAGCEDPIAHKIGCPLLIELIWSYWHEEGMLVQTLNTISLRFQNRRARISRDPLIGLTIDPLRRLNNLLWGYIQDEQHRLTVVRRAYEYDQHYGLTLRGTAVPPLESSDSRSNFLETFHNLLLLCSRYFREFDDKTIEADAFPILNALKDVHLLLAEGMHNQYGDLPWTARKEMLIQQYLLARPEMREFLGGRPMVPYKEGWMDRVDTMKKLQGWTDTCVTHFHNLAVFGEQILLTIRFLNWSKTDDRNDAAAWANEMRNELQGYIHAYRSATGVDLTADATDPRQAAERYLQPSIHLARRLQLQRNNGLGGRNLPQGAARNGRLPITRTSAVSRNGHAAVGRNEQ